MSVPISELKRKMSVSPQSLTSEFVSPVLLWGTPKLDDQDDIILGTVAFSIGSGPGAVPGSNAPQEPLVFHMKKATGKANAFAMGITVGRTENNDIAVDDPSISRFHAYFQQDARSGGWTLVDAESRNGTAVNGTALAANKPTPVSDGMLIRFGRVDMRFYEPASFLKYLKTLKR